MRSRGQDSDKIRRLEALASAPEGQRAFALQLLDAEKGVQVVQAALQVLQDNPSRDARPALLRQYAFRDTDGNRRDPGGYIRTEILRILRQDVRHEELPLFERATWTYEFMPGHDEVCSSVRANALIALNEVEPTLAAYHAVRLLTDRHTARMSGEPAVTAARILASQSRHLPLYGYAVGAGAVPEVIAECLRGLAVLPSTLLPPLVETYRNTDDEIVLIGLFDLILSHPAGAAHRDFVRQFLRETTLEDVHRYVVTAIVARREQDLIGDLVDLARSETNRRKRENLLEALSLVPNDRRVAAAARQLRALIGP